jgi:Kef-type K+ transport system membrane component KefB
LLLPVFFTVTGLSVNFAGLGMRGLIMVLAVIVVACIGKFAGAAGAARLAGIARHRSMALGVLLNARGLTELIILNVGLSLHALDSRLFTAMVIMALVTTLITGPLLTRLLARQNNDADLDAEFEVELAAELDAELDNGVPSTPDPAR